MRISTPSGSLITLSSAQFVAAGGEAEVYAVGKEAYKIYGSPDKAIDPSKIDALSGIGHDRVLVPTGVVRDPKTAATVGIAMPYLADARPLASYTTRPTWLRNRLNAARRFGWVNQLRELVAAVHAVGIQIVDLNPMNVLVDRDLQSLFLIDTDSFQTPQHPATALVESVRDRHAPPNVFSEETDWFAFAVVSFQLMMGIHPYRGHHPSLKTLDARMQGNVSVFHSDVTVPHVCESFDVLPYAWRQWFFEVFEEGQRSAPPEHSTYAVIPVITRAQPTSLSLTFQAVERFETPIYALAEFDGARVVYTENGVFLNRRRVLDSLPGQVVIGQACVGHPVLVHLHRGQCEWVDLVQRRTTRLSLDVDALSVCDGRVHLKVGGAVMELQFFRTPDGFRAVPKRLCQVHALNGQLFDGVAIQSLLGSTYVSLFTGRGRAAQQRVKALDGKRIVNACFGRGVLFVLTAGSDGLKKWVFRARGESALSGDCIGEAVSLNWTVLDGGVVVDWMDDGVLRLFSSEPHSTACREVADPALHAPGVLVSLAGGLAMIRDGTLYRLTMKTAA